METLTESITDESGTFLSERPMDLALVLAWSLSEPDRVGEVLCFADGESCVVGRGDGDFEGIRRGVWSRQRPGATRRMSALSSKRLSRRQLIVERRGSVLALENKGRAPLMFRGASVDQCTMAPGDVVSIGALMVLLCIERPRGWDEAWPAGLEYPTKAFRAPDGLGLVGESPALWLMRRQAAFVSKRERHVLLLGASGTGKELVAQAIHALSNKGHRKLISRNASTIPEGIFDAELFGNVKNYPNPGMPDRPGLVGQASGSTLFMDELGELPEPLQAHLLRLLDRGGEYHRLGESMARRSDLRLIAATNRSESALKHDFLARFTLRLQLPSLNERREDIPLLAVHLLGRAADKDPALRDTFFERSGAGFHPRITCALMLALLEHDYSHHVRELDMLLWSALTSSHDEWLRLTPPVQERLGPKTPEAPADSQTLDREIVLEAMREHKGVREKVWRSLGLKNRYVLRRLLQKHNIEKGDYSVGS